MKDISLQEGTQCTGCGACYNVCGTGAITMCADTEGFLYPKIDRMLCVKCGACESVCPMGKTRQMKSMPGAYYAYSKDEAIRRASSSGGVFTHLAQAILSKSGAVAGVMMDEAQTVRHVVIDSAEKLYMLRGSKYVQSDTGDIYRQIKQLLKAGKPVLFTGTPCQAAALRQYLSKDYDNLYVQDIICHGVPSPGVWQEYLRQTCRAADIAEVSFRDKTESWYNYALKITHQDGTAFLENKSENIYIRAFLSNLSLRPSCYDCQFKGDERAADITLADYWGVYDIHPELPGKNGISLVLTHTEKGERLLRSIQDSLVLGQTDRVRAIAMNPAYGKSVKMPARRAVFFGKIQAFPIRTLVDRYSSPSWAKRIYRWIRNLPMKVKRTE